MRRGQDLAWGGLFDWGRAQRALSLFALYGRQRVCCETDLGALKLVRALLAGRRADAACIDRKGFSFLSRRHAVRSRNRRVTEHDLATLTWAILDRLNTPLVRHTAQLDCRIDSEPFASAAASWLA